jgi:hypothetical protein
MDKEKVSKQFEKRGDGLLVRAPLCCELKVVTSRGQAGKYGRKRL